MVELRAGIAPEVKNRTVGKVMGRVKLANYLNLPEDEFRKIIREVENDPLFQRMTYPEKSEEKVLSYRRFPSSRLSQNYYEYNERIFQDTSSPGLDALLNKKQRIIRKIRSLGLDKFKKHFLYNEKNMGINDISKVCGISKKETMKMIKLVDDVTILNELSIKYKVVPGRAQAYAKVADIEREKNGFIISYIMPSFARGRYSIDFKKLFALKEKGIYSKSEIVSIDRLIVKLELINTRKDLIYRTIQCILKNQRKFFESGDKNSLNSLTQRKIAKLLGVTPGVLCRVINRKSICTPWGQERSLKYFLLSEKQRNKVLLRKIIDNSVYKGKQGYLCEKRMFSDKAIKELMRQKYNIFLSRRSICQYRNEMRTE